MANDVNQDQHVAKWVSEIIAAVDQPGELEIWVAKQLDDHPHDSGLDTACVMVAQQLLAVDPPQIGYWERLLVTLAVQSGQDRGNAGLSTCTAILAQLRDHLATNPQLNVPSLITLANALTVVLAAQNRLRQKIEQTIKLLCDTYPDALAPIAESCQDIWKRRGQMTGRKGFFIWDVRKQEWRLAQDFKSFRPT